MLCLLALLECFVYLLYLSAVWTVGEGYLKARMLLLQLSLESTQRRALLALLALLECLSKKRALLALLECLSKKVALLALLECLLAARPWSTRFSLTPLFFPAVLTPRPFAPLSRPFSFT